jgi:hypothetical protein
VPVAVGLTIVGIVAFVTGLPAAVAWGAGAYFTLVDVARQPRRTPLRV